MCGIIGYVGSRPAKDLLLEGLLRLEYRGYDSAGIVVLEDGKLLVEKKAGKLKKLQGALAEKKMEGTLGLGHTRWATHGRPTEENAHPHTDCGGNLAVVHNGIIENYSRLREDLINKGHKFVSETDTEVLAHLFEEYFEGDLAQAVRKGLKQVEGAYAIAVIARECPQQIIAARQGSPLILGCKDKEHFLASDIPAILSHTREMIFLKEGEMAKLTPASAEVFDFNGKKKARKPTKIDWDPQAAKKGGYKHFMLKEINEQPEAVADTLRGRFSLETEDIFLDEVGLTKDQIRQVKNIYLVACGTSGYAGLTARYIWEDFLDLPISVELASEFRYSKPYIDENTLIVGISQSGETADTLQALRDAKEYGAGVVSVVNVLGSSITRISDGLIYTRAGSEIGVASTKTFTSQLVALYLLGLYLALNRGTIDRRRLRKRLESISKAPGLLRKLLDKEDQIKALASKFYSYSNFLFLGRDVLYPIALEGALKLKEISYIHAEGYPAGEMKHGPIALIDEKMPVVTLVTKNSVYDKVFSNIEEVKARKGIVICFTDQINKDIEKIGDYIFEIPHTEKGLTPLLFTPPLQLLAYHVGVLRGTDVDQPRNLAKSVTVE